MNVKTILLLLISILPVILIGTYIYKKDYNKEPVSILVKLFFGGIASVIVVLVTTYVVEKLFPSLTTISILQADYFSKFIKVFFGIAIIEESSKWLLTYSLSYNSKHFDEYYDIVLYSVFTALGFACFENIFYVLEGGLTTGILRIFTAVPAHAFFGVIMGEYLGLAKIGELNGNRNLKTKGITLSILLPALFHCIYDYLAFIGNEYAIILLFATVIFGYLISVDKIKRIAQLSKNSYRVTYCTNCGHIVDGNYCTNCGKQNI